ncbi:hypothetical protein D0T87_19895 [Bacteroides sp. 51]|nr:hypothetical protein [Bacteroides sp. 51]
MEIAEAWDMSMDELPATSEQQFVAYQVQTTRQAINKFYEHCPSMPCDLVHNTSKDVPTAKYILRATNSFGKSSPEQDTFKKNHFRISILYSSDPNSYYVFGLRKIVI